MRSQIFSSLVIKFFKLVQDEENIDKERDDYMYEEEKDYQLDTNTAVSRKAAKLRESAVIKRNIQNNNYPETVSKFERDFDKHMRDLLVNLTKTKRYEAHIANLCQRLDYNDYYSNHLLRDVQIVEH